MSREDRRSLGGALGGVLSVVTLPGVRLLRDKEVDSPRPGLCPVRGVRSWLSMTPNNKGGVIGLLNAMAWLLGLNAGYAPPSVPLWEGGDSCCCFLTAYLLLKTVQEASIARKVKVPCGVQQGARWYRPDHRCSAEQNPPLLCYRMISDESAVIQLQHKALRCAYMYASTNQVCSPEITSRLLCAIAGLQLPAQSKVGASGTLARRTGAVHGWITRPKSCDMPTPVLASLLPAT